ncbi:MAG: 50S ribosomal protein L6 [bacterium]|nr:50S ribosomal protein L6 [bacterium]
MSRIGRQPITIPSGVTVTVTGQTVTVVGSKGELTLHVPAQVKVEVKDNQAVVTSAAPNLHGLFRTLVANQVVGVSTGWEKGLELSGTGYRAATSGSELNLSLGFSHPVVVKAPAGITFKVEENKITVAGIDKVLVGEVAAKIRHLRPADVYKAKGLKYVGEVIRRKPGKAAKAGATGAAA